MEVGKGVTFLCFNCAKTKDVETPKVLKTLEKMMQSLLPPPSGWISQSVLVQNPDTGVIHSTSFTFCSVKCQGIHFKRMPAAVMKEMEYVGAVGPDSKGKVAVVS